MSVDAERQNVRRHKGQRYTYAGQRQHFSQAGRELQLTVWLTECATCGAPMTAETFGEKFEPSRRCSAHKRPGKPV